MTARATALGGAAILLWSILALLTVGASGIPPLQLNAMCFTIASAIGASWLTATGSWSDLTRIPAPAFAVGVAGLAGYHLLYFLALRHAPPAEAGIIAYLWPLLIVLFSGLLPGEVLHRGHIIGAVMGFAGAVTLVAGELLRAEGAVLGYALALACALTWSGYSVLSRRFGAVPTSAVTAYCMAAALLSALASLAFETPRLPDTAQSWGAAIGLGLGPVGLAFFLWDIGVKRGNIQLLGVLSYGAPVLSTAVLVVAGVAQLTPALFVATALITGGAVIAARASGR